MKQKIRIFFLILSLLLGGLVFQESISGEFNLLTYFVAIPCFIISSSIAVLITPKSKIRFIPKSLSSLIIWLTLISILIGVLTLINRSRNLSPIIFSTKFYWEEGVDFEFRENFTFKSINHDMMSSDISYGDYTLQDSIIILEDKVKFGMEEMNDTLKISNNGIAFKMKKPWRISEGEMPFEYLPITEVKIENNTDSKIDSFLIKTYTEDQISKISIEPKQITKYKFDMKNPHVNGRYKLSYKLNNHVNQHTNILKGYPLESVETIKFENESIDVSLIFGNTITIKYR